MDYAVSSSRMIREQQPIGTWISRPSVLRQQQPVSSRPKPDQTGGRGTEPETGGIES